ncbi:MAG: glucosaminidase domain-containing protein [Flavobacteriales bacterium]|nr:glucosaminidase domain-containing protein [Flavobacteriales bacterium]
MYRFIIIALLSFHSFSLLAEKAISRNEYINLWKDEAIYQMVMHKIPASITLAQGILESGDGNSRLAREGNNHFGIKCHNDWTGERIYEDDETKGECFRQYENARDSYEDHSAFLQRKRYETLFQLDADDYKGWAKGLKECGYATNPKYPQLLIGIIEEFKLHEYDEQGLEYIKKNKVPTRSSGHESTPSTVEVKEKKPSKEKSNRNNKEERAEINITHQHEVLLSENNIRYVIAKDGDTQESIAEDFDLNAWIIRKFNDLGANEKLHAGDIVYLQPKRNKCGESKYVVAQGETLRDISQKFGVKLKKLRKYNQLTEGQEPAMGSTIKLRKSTK